MRADYAERRERMVAAQLIARGIHAEAVLQAMRMVPREAFVEPGFEDFAYQDAAVPIAQGQTISQPFIVALMAEAAEVKAGDAMLEVGACSGYAVAVLSPIAAHVSAIDAGGQTLVKVSRLPRGDFDQQALAEVAFVPLIGEQGWADEAGS